MIMLAIGALAVGAIILRQGSANQSGARQFTPPLANMILTSPFGYRMRNGKQELHTGADFAASPGTPIYAVADGTVIYAEDTTGLPYSPLTSRGGGNRIVIDHGGNLWSSYNHLSRFLVARGDGVVQGQYIADSGGAPGTAGSGVTTGPHLHFEILREQKETDPIPFLNGGAA